MPSPLRRACLRLALLAALVYPVSLVTFVTILELPSPPTAEARSGGSGGGFSRSSSSGSRSSGSRSSSSGSRSSGSRSSSPSSSGSRTSGGGGGSGGEALSGPWSVAPFVIVMLVFILAKIFDRQKKKAERMTVGRVQLAFNALRTKGLRDRIERLVRDADVTTSRGIFNLQRAVNQAVHSALEHVSHVGFLEDRNLAPNYGEGAFNRLTRQARAFYDREVVRKDKHGLREQARNSSRANELTDEDGDFGIDEFFVVTLVICVDNGPLGLPRHVGGPEDARAAIEAMLAVPEQRHIGFEVIWTPAAESDILTRDELLIDFPELAPL